MKSKLLSVSAISAGFISVCLILGAYVEIADMFTIVISSVFVTLPLYYKSYKACFLSYLAGGVIAFICSGFNIYSLVFPAYFGFFGIYPIIKCILKDKNFNKYAGFVLGIIWCVLAFVGIYFYYVSVIPGVLDGFPIWLLDYVILIVILIGAIFFIVFDKFLIVTRRVSDYYLNKIIK